MSEPIQPAPELPDDTISFPFNGEVITIAVGDDVGIETYILLLEGFTPEWQAVLLSENPPPLTVIFNSYDDTDIFTARNAAGEHVFFRIVGDLFRIVGDPLNEDGRLERVDPAELLLSKDYYRGEGDDTAAKGGNAGEATP
jgi:hypothetical protein